ncbi:MAG: ABC transporter substrate-binding protein, partial [Deltaproteobacteria bacterium HGW-Deltaproteobacteria-24]
MKRIIHVLLLLISFLSLSYGKEFEDMLGNKIDIKENITKIHASTPILLYSLYVIDKDKIAGLNFPFTQGEAQYLEKKIVDLPVLGGWFGQGRTPNSEMILQVNPDLILLSDFTKKMGEEKIKASLGHINVPLVYLKSNTLEEMIESFLYIGQLVNQEQRANTLTQYAKNSLDLAKAISKEVFKKPKVYYAEGKNGLQTECHS